MVDIASVLAGDRVTELVDDAAREWEPLAEVRRTIAREGEKVRRNLLEQCRVHTLLRLPTGIWYSPGVKANVVFFEKKPGRPEPWTDRLWVYDLRTNKHFTLKQSPIRDRDFEDFVSCYRAGREHERVPTWSEATPDGRWRAYDYADLVREPKLSLDLFWIKDESLTDPEKLPAPGLIAAGIVEDLEAALAQFTKVAARLAPNVTEPPPA